MKLTEVVTVSDARANLSRILADLEEAGKAAEPVFIGAHRKAEGVLLSVKSYEELEAYREQAERVEALASAWGSAEAEGLKPSAGFHADADDFVKGKITGEQLVERAFDRQRKKTGH